MPLREMRRICNWQAEPPAHHDKANSYSTVGQAVSPVERLFTLTLMHGAELPLDCLSPGSSVTTFSLRSFWFEGI
jgi:hypothetical protein